MLLDVFVRPLRWPDAVAALRAHGVRKVFVCGPDRLFGRVGTTTRAVEVVPVSPRAAPRRAGQPAPV